MKPAPFRYHAPKTIEEAVETLAEVGSEDGRVRAGGQSLVPIMAFRLARPAHLVDISGVEALRRLAVEGERLCIGACVRHATFHHPVVDGPLGRLLGTVVRHIAHYPIRTRGTFCGSLAHADPAARLCLVGAARCVSRGSMPTALSEDELLTEVRLPMLPADTRFGFYEFNRRAGDFALAMALVTFRVQDGVIAEPCVAVGGVEPQPRRIAQAEQVLVGRPPDLAAFQAAAAAVASAVDPLEDANTSATYRRDLTRPALEQAAA